MNKLNISFIGGCINNQKSISKENLYNSVLAELFKKNNIDTEVKISLSTYVSYHHLNYRVEKLIARNQPDIIFLFIRPFPLMPLHKPFIKYDKANRKKGWAAHPALFSKKLIWNNKLTKFQVNNEVLFIPKEKFALRDINLVAGFSIGLHRWALKYLSKQISSINLLCQENKIKLFIISPPKNPESIIGNIICKRTTKYLEKYCTANQLDLININSLPTDNFENDNIHYNIEGHKKLGECFYTHLNKKTHL